MGSLPVWTVYSWALLLLVFVIVVLLVTGFAPVVLNRARVRRRLPEITGGGRGALIGGSVRADRTEGFWSRLVATIERRGVSLADTKGESLRSRLIAAGYDRPEAPALYTLARIALSLGLPALFVALSLGTQGGASILKLYLMGAGLAVFGLYLPQLWVNARAARRQRDLLNGFPDALDLMLVCVEAGLGIDAAFQRVGAEIMNSHPLLAHQLATVTLELRAGRSREEAMRRMAERTGVQEIRSFATLVVQSERLGSSIAQTLRIYAAEMRERRRLRAEEKAHRLPVLLSVPLVACMLPTMIGVLMLPAAIRVIRELLPAMTN